MRRFAILGLVLVGLAGCEAISPEGDRIARDAAKGVVNSVVSARYPGADVAPVTDCIIDNATGAEVIQIAQAAVVGTTSQTTQLVFGIAQRPATVQCIAEKTLNVGTLRGAL